MIRIYCQYSVAGFKIFNLTSFPHEMEGGRFVRMNEISEGLDGKKQNIFVTRNCDCGLDHRIMSLFSTRSVSMLMLKGCGEKRNETILFVDDLNTQTAYAFSATDPSEIDLLIRMAAVWNSDKKEELVRRLQNLVGKPIIEQEPTFAFYEEKWKDLAEDIKRTNTPLGKLERLRNPSMNLLCYLAPNKGEILKHAKIDIPLSSFITIPGNEDMERIERQRTLTYVASGVVAVIVLGILLYCIAR